jgi:hypothetical protein
MLTHATTPARSGAGGGTNSLAVVLGATDGGATMSQPAATPTIAASSTALRSVRAGWGGRKVTTR